MGITLIKRKTSFVITPISNILFGSKKIIDQELIEEVPFYNGDLIEVFDLNTQSVNSIKAKDVGDNHWYYRECGTLFKILHIIKD